MELHGPDDPTTEVDAMYSPDSHAAGADADAIGPGLGSSGDGLEAGVPADPQGVELDVDGHVSEVSATIDTDHDGRADTAIINADDGAHMVITDSDHDGVVDRALLVDDHGRVVDSATFDRSTGHWHGDDTQHGDGAPGGGTHGGDATSGGGHAAGTVGTQAAVAAAAGPPGPATEIEFDADGRTATVEATVDTDDDGRPDTAIVDGGDSGTVAVTDTDGDGHADEAALIRDGRVVDTAHVDPHTGQWVRGDDGHNPYSVGESVPEAGGSAGAEPAGTGASGTGPTDDGSGSGTMDGGTATTGGSTTTGDLTGGAGGDPSGTGDTTTTASEGPSHGRERPITVDAGGRTSTIEATIDANHDGVNETAVVQGVDGTRVSFSDTDGDGEADHATVIDVHGNVVGTARYDPISGEWTDTASS